MALPKLALIVALVAWLPTYWLGGFSQADADGYSRFNVATAGAVALVIGFVVKFVWKLISKRRAASKAAKELKQKKIRLWNKLEGGGSAVRNSKTICVLDYFNYKAKVQQSELDPVDAVEAFQAKTLLLDDKYSKIKEVVYDADVQAFLLMGREKDTLIPAATYYISSSLLPSKPKDDDEDRSVQESPIVSKLQEEGAFSIAVVDKSIDTVCSLLLNHGAHFYVGQFSKSSLPKVLAQVTKRSVFAAVMPNATADDNFIIVLTCDTELLSLVTAALTDGGKEGFQAEEQQKHRVGYVFMSQRKSSTHGKLLSQQAVTELLKSSGQELVQVSADGLFAAAAFAGANAAGMKDEASKIFSQHKLSALAFIAGSCPDSIAQLGQLMNLQIFSLTDHLTEVYICLSDEAGVSGLGAASAVGKAIRL